MYNNNLNEVVSKEEIKNYLKALVKFAEKRKMLEELNKDISTCINSGGEQRIHIYKGISLLASSVNKEIMYDNNGSTAYFCYKGIKFFEIEKTKFENLVECEMDVLELSNELQKCGCEDIGYFGNLDDLMEDGNMVVATNESGEECIQIFYEVLIKANEDILATQIRIKRIDNF